MELAVMSIGPAVAIAAAVEMAGLITEDIDVHELNEAAASQVCACDQSQSIASKIVMQQTGEICVAKGTDGCSVPMAQHKVRT